MGKALRDLVKRLRKEPVQCIVLEAGLPVIVVISPMARRYAGAIGQLVKKSRPDADLIAGFSGGTARSTL